MKIKEIVGLKLSDSQEVVGIIQNIIQNNPGPITLLNTEKVILSNVRLSFHKNQTPVIAQMFSEPYVKLVPDTHCTFLGSDIRSFLILAPDIKEHYRLALKIKE